jgi:mono/diheme cytochrome c family protein
METRLLVLHDDGAWTGYSYAWNETGTDATLLTGSSTAVFGDTEWSYPSRAECLRCHTTAAGNVLGVRTEQLNGDHTYDELGGGTYNQLEALDAMGFFTTTPGAADSLPAWPSPTGTASATDRGRAYVASNCAFCHLPEGTGGGTMDLRYATAFAEMGICAADPINGDLDVDGAVLFDPGSPDTSLIALRMGSVDAHRMPPLGTSLVDDDGLAAVRDWISETSACE